VTVSRRHFLRQAAAVSAGFGGLHLFVLAGDTSARFAPEDRTGRFGPLVPDPDGVFDLPEGFSYRIISRFGDVMDDGLLVPHRPDGMAAFPGPDGRVILVCNHEVSDGREREEGAFGPDFALARRLEATDFFDPGREFNPAGGGTTTIVYDPATGETVRRFLSLAGTLRNCAGGPTPWNSWITCEESVVGPTDTLARAHGWAFEVPATTEPGLAAPRSIEGMGRFYREAVALDPDSGVVYQTEDRGDGLIYRFVPDAPGDLHAGGRQQALVVRGRPGLDTRNWDVARVEVGTSMPVEWIDMEDIDSAEDDLRYRGFAGGAARFARAEGMWYGNETVYFACTNGGAARLGQIWKYTPSKAEGAAGERDTPGMLELFLESESVSVLENADNLTVAPWGDLFVCEDGRQDQFLIGVTPEGDTYRFGRNAISTSELAGATFSPDGSTLFMNIQGDGLTLAITGPWERRNEP
jgi:hypothetical protein